jgi:thymidylate synthase (FAD)
MIERTADQIDVLDHGFVRLDGVLADDLSVVNGARVSFGSRRLELDERDAGLVRFLMRERHGSPFEHNLFRFHVKCPLYVAREWQRHRFSSFNERSARYSEMPDEFCVPAAEDVRTQVGKPGAYRFERVDDELAERTRETIAATYREAYEAYRRMLADGIAKEVARAVLPVGLYTEFYWSVNARSLMNFLSLRNAEPAQREIRAFAEAVEAFFAREMPITHEAFLQNDRIAP